MVADVTEINSAGNLRILVSKMPPRLIDQWGRHVYGLLPDKPTMVSLADWLDEIITSQNLVGRPIGVNTEKQKTAVHPKRPNVFAITDCETVVGALTTHPCSCCQRHHDLTDC